MAGGRIVFEDGTSVPDPDLFVSGMLSTVGNPNLILSTILPISAGGVFGGVPDKGELRFYFRSLPEEYEIRSIMAGSVDLTKETLKFDGTQSFFIETRVARRTANSPYSSVQVGGTVRDASGAIPPAGRVELCCRDTGPAEAFSAPVRADGSFQFSGVPPGKYTPRLSVAGQGAIIGAVSATVGVLSGARDRVRLQLVVGSTGTPLVPVAIEIPTPR
jgi:hypothetical protein